MKRRWFIYLKNKRVYEYGFASEGKARAYIRRHADGKNEDRFEYRKEEVQ